MWFLRYLTLHVSLYIDLNTQPKEPLNTVTHVSLHISYRTLHNIYIYFNTRYFARDAGLNIFIIFEKLFVHYIHYTKINLKIT